MDPIWQANEVFTSQAKGVIGNPYPSRPWLQDKAAAAPASGNIGVKGVIAGNIFIILYLRYLLYFSFNIFIFYFFIIHYKFMSILSHKISPHTPDILKEKKK